MIIKELSTEEKAKAYDESLERARKLYNNNDTDPSVEIAIEEIFQELEESEDEKIRKEIIDLIERAYSGSAIILGNKERLLAWLKKQGNLMKCLQKANAEIGKLVEENYYLKEKKSVEWNNDDEWIRKELIQLVKETAKEEAVLRARREECAAKIDARTMSAYERIRESVHNHLAVVGIYNGDSCGGCFNTITPQRRVEIASNRKLIICEHCGRIIINPDFQQ